MRLNNKVALITGAGSGLGKASAELFAKEGAKIIVVDINPKGGIETVKSIKENGGDAIFIRADVSKAFEVENMVSDAMKNYKKLDIVFNNAGVALPKSIIDTTEDEWDKVIDVNLKGMFLVSKNTIPELIKNGGGSIINMSSGLGIYTAINRDTICASKGGIIALTKAMALSFAQYNIRVNSICPGPILTPIFRNVSPGEDFEVKKARAIERIPLARLGMPEEVAYTALFLASDESSYITGAALPVDGGLSAGNNKI